jgi:hypothetical protein
MILALFALLACGEDDGPEPTDDSSAEGDADTDADTDSDTDTDAPASTAAGEIELRDGSLSGTMAIARAFSFSSDNAIFVYASSNPDASCGLMADLFDKENKSVDRTDLFLDGHCNLTISQVGGMEVEAHDLQVDVGGSVQTECAFGEGDWELSGSGSEADYYWTGEYYVAGATHGTYDILWHDQGAGQMVLDVDLDHWEGTFPYSDDRPGSHKASSPGLKGLIYTEHCEGIEQLGIF